VGATVCDADVDVDVDVDVGTAVALDHSVVIGTVTTPLSMVVFVTDCELFVFIITSQNIK
jgi:hypothetical protein